MTTTASPQAAHRRQPAHIAQPAHIQRRWLSAQRMTILRCMLIAACLFAASSGQVRAQWNAALSTEHRYDNNSFAMHDRRADAYHQIFGSVSRDYQSDYSFSQLYWYGAVVLFRTYADRTYTQHTIGFYHQIQLDHRDNDEEDESNDASDEEGSADDGAAAPMTIRQSDGDSAEESAREGFSDDRTVVDEAGASDDSTAVDDGGASDDSTAVDEGGGTGQGITARSSTGDDPASSTSSAPGAGAASAMVPGDSLVSYLILRPSIAGRFDHAAWDFYDHRAAGIAAGVRMHVSGPLMGRFQYEGQYKDYPNLGQFTNIENTLALLLSARLSRSVELFAQFDAGLKSYTEAVNDTTWEGGGNGKGKGGVKSKKAVVSRFSTPSTSQVVGAIGCVLTPSETTQLSLSLLRRSNPSNDARYADVRAFDRTATEGEVFDDRYGYESYELAFQATRTLGSGVQILTTLELGARAYARTAATLAGEIQSGAPQRSDGRLSLDLGVSIPVLRNTDGSTLMALGAGYRYIRNASNDEYHDYHIHQGAITLDLSL